MNIDTIIVGLFLTTTLIAGFYYGTGTKSFQEYAVGNRKMSNTKMAISLIATTGGVVLHARLESYYHQGLYAFIVDFGSKIAFYLAFSFITVRMKEFVSHFSVAESMGSLYGPVVRLITGIVSILMTITILVTQIRMGLYITSYLFPEIANWSTSVSILLTLLVMVYSTLGGAKTVALTDVYQFFLFGIGFPMLMFVLLYYAKKPLAGWSTLAAMPQFNMGKMFTWHNTLTSLVTYFIWRPEFPFDPARIQRFYMVSSLQQATKVLKRSVLFQILFALLFLIVALVLHIGGHIIIKSNPYNVLDYIMKLAYFPGMRGILISAIVALLISKADSNLHTASVLFAHDVWPILRGSSQPSLKIVRSVSIVIGFISLLLVWHVSNIIALLGNMIHLYGPIVAIPFLMAILGFRPRPAVVLLSMGINLVLSLYRMYYKIEAISQQDVLQSLVISIVILLATHYLLPKRPHTGWVGIKDRSLVDLHNQEIKRWWIERLQQFTITFTKKYRESIFPKKERTFILLGIYLIISTTIALCFVQEVYLFPYVYGYIAVAAIGTSLALYPACPFYKPGGTTLLHWIWLGLLFMVFFMANLQWVKLSHANAIICLLFVLNLGLGITFLSLTVSIAMLTIAIIIHSYLSPSVLIWNLFCALTIVELVSAIGLGVAAMVSLYIYKRLHTKTNRQLNVMKLTRNYERRISLEVAYNQTNWSRLDATYGGKTLLEMGEVLQDSCHYLPIQGQEKLGTAIDSFMQKLHKFSNFLPQRINTERCLELNQKAIKSVEIESIILKARGYIRGLGEKMQLLVRNETEVTQLLVDPELFEYLLTINLLAISESKQASNHTVCLTIRDTALHYNGTIATEASRALLTLPALAFFISTDAPTQHALALYHVSGTFTPVCLPKSAHQFYQSESKQIVQAHGGFVEVIEHPTALTCCYVLPIAGQKVMRFRTYDPAQLNNAIAETAASLAQEKELVTLLTTETALTKETVEKTIALIKKAHGLVVRKSGEPYYTHPMAVAKMLLEVTKEPSTLLAGLLHDVVEDTSLTLNQLELMYDAQVAYIVDMVTHYNTHSYPWKFDKEENNSMLEECQDIRVVQVKFADRLHNIRTLSTRKLVDQKRVAQETMAFYIPWGKKHGMLQEWLVEMQYICKQVMDYER